MVSRMHMYVANNMNHVVVQHGSGADSAIADICLYVRVQKRGDTEIASFVSTAS